MVAEFATHFCHVGKLDNERRWLSLAADGGLW
jgi:hypothetical protein